jgi:EpsI family protein
MGAGLLASLPALRAENTPTRQPLALFPMEFKNWRGAPRTLDTELVNSMGFTDYLLADYTDYTNDAAVGRPLNFYVAYYASQHAGAHPHSPQFCIPGGGWTIASQSIVALPFNEGASIDVNRVIIEKHDVRQVVYYWFEERGRHIAREDALRYYAIKDAILDNRSDGALVRIVVTIYNGDEVAADSIVRKFVADTGPLIQSYVPGATSQASRIHQVRN